MHLSLFGLLFVLSLQSGLGDLFIQGKRLPFLEILKRVETQKQLTISLDSNLHEIKYLGVIQDSSGVSYAVYTDFIKIKICQGIRGKSKLFFVQDRKDLHAYIFEMPGELPKAIRTNNFVYHKNGEEYLVEFLVLQSLICTPFGCFENDDSTAMSRIVD